jgi:hypothetical protein
MLPPAAEIIAQGAAEGPKLALSWNEIVIVAVSSSDAGGVIENNKLLISRVESTHLPFAKFNSRKRIWAAAFTRVNQQGLLLEGRDCLRRIGSFQVMRSLDFGSSTRPCCRTTEKRNLSYHWDCLVMIGCAHCHQSESEPGADMMVV